MSDVPALPALPVKRQSRQLPGVVDDALLTIAQVETIVNLSHTTVYKLMAEGGFPRPVQVGERLVAWRWSDVAEWMCALPVAGAKKGAEKRDKTRDTPRNEIADTQTKTAA